MLIVLSCLALDETALKSLVESKKFILFNEVCEPYYITHQNTSEVQ